MLQVSLHRKLNLLMSPALSMTMQVALLAAPALETLLDVEPGPGHIRNSEGDIEVLNDGSLCLIYTQFRDSDADHGRADLVQRLSRDDGRSWSAPEVIVTSDGGQNVMSVSLLRLRGGKLALFYLNKVSDQDCRPMMRTSGDEAATWSEPRYCISDEISYYVLNNDRAVQLSSGRLVLPVAQHRIGEDQPAYIGTVMCYLSDDEGTTWRRSRTTRQGIADGKRFYVQEPGIVELSDGRLWMYCRTDRGFQYGSDSEDGGDSWSPLTATSLASPRSPATIKRVPWSGRLLSLWNDHGGAHPFKTEVRSPWCAAVSGDEGRTFGPSVAIENDPNRCYCYSSATFHGDRLLVTYSAGIDNINQLGRLKVAAIPKQWIDALTTASAGLLSNSPDDASTGRCLDYSRSFVQAKAGGNSPRFWVESRLSLRSSSPLAAEEYLQCGSCKSEHTFAEKDLFTDANYDFLPVFGRQSTVVFRQQALFHEGYRELRPTSEWWGGNERRLRRIQPRVLQTLDEIRAALFGGLPLVGLTEIRDDRTGNFAEIEYPIKTFNWSDEKRQWQVDTGPVLLPDLSVPPDRWAESFEVAFVAFNRWDEADFIVRGKTPVDIAGGQAVDVHHFERKVHLNTRNRLLACEGAELDSSR